MGTLTDDDLTSLLAEAADSFAVPQDGTQEVLAELDEQAAIVPWHQRRRVRVAAAAAVLVGGIAVGTALFAGNEVDRVGQLAGAERPAAGSGGSGEQAGVGVDGTATDFDTTGVSPTGGRALTDQLAFTSSAGGSNAARVPAAPAPAAGLAPGAAVPAPAAPTADGARVVKTGAIALVVEDGRVTPVLTQVQSLAAAVGGEVSVARTEELGPTPSGSVTLRVPVDDFEEVVARVRSLDAEVRSATTSGRDVTAEYADLETQIRTLKAARERFLEILSRARTIGDVLAVQQRVDEVTGRIDRLEGQRQVLAAQSERATLEVSVTEKDDPVVTQASADDGLSQAFSDAWRGFTSGVEGLIRLSGRGVLLLMVLALGYGVLRLAWRASRRRLV